MNNQNRTVYAALNNGTSTILGKVFSFSDKELIFQSVSDGNIELGSFHPLDVYSSDLFYFQKLTVEIVADDKFIDEKFFTKMTIRHVRVRYHNGGIVKQIPSSIKNSIFEPNSVIKKLIKWHDGVGGSNPLDLTEAEVQEIFRWMSHNSVQ